MTNGLFGKLVFVLAVMSVVFREKFLPREFDVGDCIYILMIGFFLMLAGSFLDSRKQMKRIKLEDEKKKKWIDSLYGK